MKTIKELKRDAKATLKGHYSVFIISFLVYFGISLVSNFIPILGPLAFSLIAPIIMLGFCYQSFKLAHGHEIKVEDMFSQWRLGLKYWIAQFLIGLMLSIPMFIVGIIFGILAANDIILILYILILPLYVVFIHFSLRVALIQYVILDNPSISAKDAIKTSIKLTKNNTLRYFGLVMSFIPLLLVSTLALFIPYLWLMPYITMSQVQFYLDLKEQYNENEIYE